MSSGSYSQAGVGEAGQVSLGAAWGFLDGQLLSLSEPQGGLGWTISGAPLCPVLCNLRMALGMPVTRSASCLQPTPHSHSSGSALFPLVSLVYPSLESDEDSPVFKSRSKKRKASDDAPYSPTGCAGAGGGSSAHI